MLYCFIAVLLFFAMLIYLRIADRYNIIDKPNQRSSHTKVTIRGGGVVFYFSALAWFIWSGATYPYFFAGLTLMALISFLDDILTLANRIRINVHLLSVVLMFLQVQLFDHGWWVVPIALILVLVIGTINTYSFMDGINGIMIMYSFAVLLLLWLANRDIGFVDDRLLYCTAIANGVFTVFNFRQRAKCFAGDVGNVSICFILLFATLSLILTTGNPIYILFFAVYGVDSVMTIVCRLWRHENIFKPERASLYRYLAHEGGGNPLIIATCYGILQLGIGLLILIASKHETQVQNGVIVCLLVLLIMSYIGVRHYVWAGKFRSPYLMRRQR